MEPTLYENERVLINRVVYYFRPPGRGDIVILEDPLGSPSDFVKRIVALPGDIIEIRNGKTYVNSKPLSEPYVANDMDNENVGPIKISSNHFFVMGDNRPKSSDSRRFGSVSRRNILGKVFIVWWPPNRIHVPY
jgi:signal peptidase I